MKQRYLSLNLRHHNHNRVFMGIVIRYNSPIPYQVKKSPQANPKTHLAQPHFKPTQSHPHAKPHPQKLERHPRKGQFICPASVPMAVSPTGAWGVFGAGECDYFLVLAVFATHAQGFFGIFAPCTRPSWHALAL